MLCSLLLLALVAAAQGRAVNISNTWVLPEEGFPVFYRYFRDRISWYEADAVCQFHHANLVTVDTTAQYDAVRAYLKELDISSAVWVGLIRSNPDGDFTWTDYRGLSGDGYWSSAPDARSAPLCAAADPAADYRWEARACGGPSVASFICELPVPQWALGNEGCMVRALPALTVLYLPESAAVQLTADCGMAGVKRVQCTGNVKHEDLLRDLSCNEDDESSPPTTLSSIITTMATAETDQDVNDASIEESITTEHEDDIKTLNYILSTPDLLKHISVTQKKVAGKEDQDLAVQTLIQDNAVVINKNVDLDVAQHNNLQSNNIPKVAFPDEIHYNEQMEKLEDEKHMQHKLLQNELARLGTIDNIFSQPTDHFVPPLVMAKAKINEDMTAVSFEEKLAQQHTEYRLTKTENENDKTLDTNCKANDVKSKIEALTTSRTTELPQTTAINIIKDKKEINKNILPKKFDHISADMKRKLRVSQTTIFVKDFKSTTASTDTATTATEVNTLKNIKHFDSSNEDNALDLTIVIKEPESLVSSGTFTPFPFRNIQNTTSALQQDTSIVKEQRNISTTQGTQIENESNTESNIMQNITLNDEIIKITFIHDNDYDSTNSTVFEITTRTPIFKDNTENSLHTTTPQSFTSISLPNRGISTTSAHNTANTNTFASTPTVEINDKTNILEIISTRAYNKTATEISKDEVTTADNIMQENVINTSSPEYTQLIVKDTNNNVTESESLDYFEKHSNDTYIDDFQSPLLSGANEPLHKPNRSRRPQQPNRIKKFNPFRILG